MKERSEMASPPITAHWTRLHQAISAVLYANEFTDPEENYVVTNQLIDLFGRYVTTELLGEVKSA